MKHPADLANHPTLSLPFLDSALPDMLRSTEDKLRQERANLWRAKNQNRQFIGDESWVPSHVTEGLDDWDLFEPKPRLPALSPRKKRKTVPRNETLRNGVLGYTHSNNRRTQNALEDDQPSPKDISTKETADTTENVDAPVEQPVAMDIDTRAGHKPTTNGVYRDAKSPEDKGTSKISPKQEENGGVQDTTDKMDIETGEQDDEQGSEDGTPPQHTRRITRALAAEQEGSNAPSLPDSPHSSASTIDSSLLQPDPLFLLPPSLAANHRAPRHLARLGLPVEEFLETRRLLTMYIQKQEESVRGYEALLGKLIRAQRMRDKVWEWCKAEGHVGEWSDGEDWIDAEAWGLQPDELKKGKDEEEVEGQEDTGRKGKRRRRD